jgi:hypothetical protein
MKLESITFLCDETQCREQITILYARSDIDAYLDLVAAGWTVHRPITKPWRHLCTTHAAAAVALKGASS